MLKSFKAYLKRSIWEYVLCILISCSVSVSVLSGFYISEELQFNYVLLLMLSGIMTALCILGAYNRRTVICLVGILVMLTAGFLIYARRLSENVFRDNEDNPYLFFIIVFIIILAVFLLTRTKTGTGILFAGGCLVMAAIQFMYESNHIAALILFICASGIMFIYKSYERNVLKSETAQTAFSRAFLTSAVAVIVIAALSSGIAYGIITAFEPPARELKLITKYMALQTWQKIGVADYNEILDPDKMTSQTDDKTKTSKNQNDEKDEKIQKNSGEKKQDSDEKNNPTRLDSSITKGFYVIGYLKKIFKPLYLAIIIIVLLAAAVALRLLQRKRWLKRLESRPRNERVKEMFMFYMKKFKHLKIRKRGSDTLLQFLEHSETQLTAFSSGNADFKRLTEIYMGVVYGNKSISDDEMDCYLLFHNSFYKNCREYLGNFKYIMKFFIL